MMKVVLLIVALALVLINANPLRRQCECQAVSNTVHFPFKSWDLSTCHFCSCKDAAMTTCEESCKAMVENYAKGGCGAVPKGSIVKYSWEASSCSAGISQAEYKCV